MATTGERQSIMVTPSLERINPFETNISDSTPPSRAPSLAQSGHSTSSLGCTPQRGPATPASPNLSHRTIRFSLNDLPGSDRSRGGASLASSPRESTSSIALQTTPERMPRHRPVSSTAPLLRRSSSMRSTASSCVRKPYPSTKLSGPLEKPWTQYPDPAHRWGRIIFWIIVALGFAGAGAIVALGYLSIPTPGKLCLVMDDDFSRGINPEHWTHEVRVDGFGNKQFEWTTADPANSFVDDSTLYLVPTLTSDSIGTDAVNNGYTLNLTADGRCTGVNSTQCVAVSNTTTGAIINPVQGVRLTSMGKASIRYGKVEVIARMPTGDWIWPAIWMMPQDNTYGEWPRSGEIDIAESRGNNHSYSNLGQDYITSALHWGPNDQFDSYWRTFGNRQRKVDGFAGGFNKYTLEWTDKYLTTYVNNRAYSVVDLRFDQTFWSRGKFPNYYVNGTETLPLTNPWYSSPSQNAPFDQSFYLILNVAVGGTNGFFPDNVGQKPWLDSSLNAMADFWKAKDRWYPTWPQDPKKRGMAVKSVKMWRQC